jgi:hypothetical protein
MAAGQAYPTSKSDLERLTSVLSGSLSLEKPAETLIDYAVYLGWKGFSAGATVTYALRGLLQGRTGSNQLVPGRVQDRQTLLLQSINEERASLWLTQRAYDPGGTAHPPRDSEIAYPAKIPQPKTPVATSVDSGQETLEIGGKRIATRWQSVSSPYGKCTMVTKTWISDEVPSGLVRKTEVSDCPEYPKRETILESFEGVRQPGFTNAPFATPAAPTVSSTPAAPQPPAVPSTKRSASGFPPRPAAPTVPANATAPPAASATNTGPELPAVLQAPLPPGTLRSQTSNPATSVPPQSNGPAPVLAPSGTAGGLLARYNSVSSRATSAKAGVAAFEQRLNGQGLALRADIRDARSRLDTQLRAAVDAIQVGNEDRAEESLRYAENALSTMEKFLGT